MTIILIGDVHGFTENYQNYIKTLPAGQRTIQLGDMGLGFPGKRLDEMEPQHTWFRGNHDSPERCRAHKNYRGDFGYDQETGIFHIAGAFSIDRAYRIEGKSWWRDEELSYQQLDEAIALYREKRPRFVVSHEAPAKAGITLLHIMQARMYKMGCTQSRTAEALQQMLDYWQPLKWCFGHYHFDKDFYAANCETKFIAIGGMMEPGEPPHTYELNLGVGRN